MKIRFILPALLLLILPSTPLVLAEDSPAVTLKVHTADSLKKIFASAAPKLADQGIKLKVTAGGGAGEAAVALGVDAVDLALTLRPLSGEERAAFPEKSFTEIELGKQVVALIVPEILWKNGIQSLTREQAAGIYESKITNWNQMGGPNRTVKFFNPIPGQGLWEMFASWVYGDIGKAAAGHFETVDGSENASLTVQFNSGALSTAYLRWANRKDLYPLAIKDEAGVSHEPTLENIVSGKYPLCRSVFIVLTGKPLGMRRKVIEWLNGPDGRELLKNNEIIPAAELSGKVHSDFVK